MDVYPLTADTYWAIINDEIDDDAANQLVWHYLGYRYDPQTQAWNTDQVAADWRDAYPEPPRFTDSRPATVKLTRSIPKQNKQLLKTELGFTGYTIDQLEPRKTRRATMTSWLMSHAQQQG
ncbi:MAG: DUF1823 family protein [Cyanobacteria bacterium P01_A01_bin.135]